MSRFQYFLYENFDADRESENPMNPRRFLNDRADRLFSEIKEAGPFSVTYASLCKRFEQNFVDLLLSEELLLLENGRVAFGFPIFFSEDIPIVRQFAVKNAKYLAELLEKEESRIVSAAREIRNGFDVKVNLYHVLCGMIFDGALFDYLCEHHALSVSKQRSSGLDYLMIAYEACDAARAFSNGLLCSYNRFSDGGCSLQSFGDADGDRFDFYRFSRLKEQGRLSGPWAQAERLISESFDDNWKETLLSQTRRLAYTGDCDRSSRTLLACFGYVQDERINVPVFRSKDRPVIQQIRDITINCLGDEIKRILLSAGSFPPVVCSRHRVSTGEIANELYHLLFGLTNEALVQHGFVCSPPFRAGEGRYLQCIDLIGDTAAI